MLSVTKILLPLCVFHRVAVRVTLALWGVNLGSISACTLCYIYLSYHIYQVSGSLLLSELVLFTPMLMPVLFIWQIHRLTEYFSPKSLMISGNSVGLLICILIFSSLNQYRYIAPVGAAAIGTIDAIQRVARIVAVKQYFSIDQVKLTVPLTLTAQFIAGGLAGGLMSIFKGQLTPSIVLGLICLLFLLSALCAFPIPPQAETKNIAALSTKEQSTWQQFITLLHHNPLLGSHFLAFILLITFFQGFFNVSRVTLPAHQPALPSQFVGLLQLVNSGAALVGALVFYWGSRRDFSFSAISCSFLSALAMVLACCEKNGMLRHVY